jgi:hypothetical protein
MLNAADEIDMKFTVTWQVVVAFPTYLEPQRAVLFLRGTRRPIAIATVVLHPCTQLGAHCHAAERHVVRCRRLRIVLRRRCLCLRKTGPDRDGRGSHLPLRDSSHSRS